MPQLRQNIVSGEWIVISPERAKRPNEFVSASQPKAKARQDCPFCVGSQDYQQRRLQHYETDLVYVLANKFPAFVEQAKPTTVQIKTVEDDFYLSKPAVGGHDVLVIKDHQQDLYTFSKEIWRDLLVMAQLRYRHFGRNCQSQYTTLIYNEQSAAGASILHPHAQIFSADIVPNIINRELTHSQIYFQNNGQSVFAALIEHEKQFKQRLVEENEHYLAFTQYAARFPFETWIVPKYQNSHFESINHQQLASLIPLLIKVFKKLGLTLNNPAVNFFIHSAPHALKEVEHFRWHLEIAPRLTNYGGFELGSGLIIDIISPESAAEWLNAPRSAK